MATTARVEDILKLGVDERLRIVELIWESLVTQPEQVSVTDAQRAVLDERLADHEANPHDVISWDDLKDQLRFR
jgi:putative addiction module component (TIGR02574 family)